MVCGSSTAVNSPANDSPPWLRGLAGSWPGYGWERNKGYATAEHLEALRRLGWSQTRVRVAGGGPDNEYLQRLRAVQTATAAIERA